jgi:hypothetical protein
MAFPGSAKRDTSFQDTLRTQLQAIWQEAMKQAPGSPHALKAVRTYLAEPLLAADEWQRRGGRILGVIEQHRLAELWPAGMGSPPRWHHAVVVPLHDATGLGGLWLSGERRHIREERWLFPGKRPAGLLMQHALAAPPGNFGDRLFLFLEPVVALKVQLRHLGDSENLLPVVATSPLGATVENCVDGRRQVTVWTSALCAEAIRHARAVSGNLVVARSNLQSSLERIVEQNSQGYLYMLLRQARPWQEVLVDALAALPLEQVTPFVRSCGMSAAELELFLDGPGAAVAGRLRNQRRVRVDGATIEERDDGWYHLESGERLTSFRVRIDEVLYLSSTATSWYRGRLLLGAQEVSFSTPVEQLRRRPGRFLEPLLARHGQAMFLSRRWATRLSDIAVRFREPVVRQADERLGADGQGGVFLPGLHISAGGVQPREVELPDMPAATCNLSVVERPELPASVLVNGPTARLFWSVCAWTVQALCATARDEPVNNLAVPLRPAWLASWVRQLGLSAVHEQDSTRALPAVLPVAVLAGRCNGAQGLLAGAPLRMQRLLLGLQPGWIVMAEDLPARFQPEAVSGEVFSWLVTRSVQLLLRARGTVTLHQATVVLVNQTGDARLGWLKHLSPELRAPASSGVATNLRDLLTLLHRGGDLDIVPEAIFTRRSGTMRNSAVLVHDQQTLWFSCTQLSRLLARPDLAGPCGLEVPHGRLCDCLAALPGVFFGERTLCGVRGICISDNWFRAGAVRMLRSVPGQ